MEKRRRAGLILVRAPNQDLARAIKDILEEEGYRVLIVDPGDGFPENVEKPVLVHLHSGQLSAPRGTETYRRCFAMLFLATNRQFLMSFLDFGMFPKSIGKRRWRNGNFPSRRRIFWRWPRSSNCNVVSVPFGFCFGKFFFQDPKGFLILS